MSRTEYTAAFAAELEKIMKDRGYSVAMLAEETGVSYMSLLCRFKSGGLVPFTVDECFRITEALQVPAVEPFKRASERREVERLEFAAQRAGDYGQWSAELRSSFNGQGDSTE